VAANYHKRQCNWSFWLDYITPFSGVDAMLTTMVLPDPNGIELLLGFAHQIKWGHERDGSKVRAGSMQVVLHAIGKTLNLDGQPNPTYCSEGKYWLKIR
jgi:hypothetical protein